MSSRIADYLPRTKPKCITVTVGTETWIGNNYSQKVYVPMDTPIQAYLRRHTKRGNSKEPSPRPLFAFYPVPPVPIGDPLYGLTPTEVEKFNEKERVSFPSFRLLRICVPK